MGDVKEQRLVYAACRGAFLKGAFLKGTELHFLKGAEVQRSQSIPSVNIRKAEFREEEKSFYVFLELYVGAILQIWFHFVSRSNLKNISIVGYVIQVFDNKSASYSSF